VGTCTCSQYLNFRAENRWQIIICILNENQAALPLPFSCTVFVQIYTLLTPILQLYFPHTVLGDDICNSNMNGKPDSQTIVNNQHLKRVNKGDESKLRGNKQMSYLHI
jgi:hypothetical protein